MQLREFLRTNLHPRHDELAQKVADHVNRGRGTRLINRLLDEYKLIQTRINELQEQTGEAATAERHLELSREAETVVAINTNLKYVARSLINNIRNAPIALPYVRIQIEMLNVLRNRSQGDLQYLIDLSSQADDGSDVRQYLLDNFDLIECDDCGQLEFDEQLCETHSGTYVCRRCISDNYSHSDYYQTYVLGDRARWALLPNQEEVLIHEDDDHFEYNDNEDRWTHVNWSPPTPPIIGQYHSSKQYFSLKIDDWVRQHGLLFGAELEVEVREGDRDDHANNLNDLINESMIGNKVFFENDGSLSHGFEIITQPMSLPAHRELWQWTNNRSATRGLRSHQTDTCGLHVHISRSELTGMQIAKMIAFINDPENESLIRAVARRYATGYCKIKTKKIVDDGSELLESGDRYEAVNITPRRTIELRIFKGSLNYKAIVSALEFTYALTQFTKGSLFQPEHLKAQRFLEFINNSMADDTSVLRPYIGQRMGLSLDGQQAAEAQAEIAVTQ